jgi:hypothetical protein
MAAYQEKRLAASQALTVASAAGAAVSTTIFGSETYAIAFPDSVSSTGGMRIAVIDVGAAVVSSITGTGYRIQGVTWPAGFRHQQ